MGHTAYYGIGDSKFRKFLEMTFPNAARPSSFADGSGFAAQPCGLVEQQGVAAVVKGTGASAKLSGLRLAERPRGCLDPWATVGPSLFRVTSRPILRSNSVNGHVVNCVADRVWLAVSEATESRSLLGSDPNAHADLKSVPSVCKNLCKNEPISARALTNRKNSQILGNLPR